AVMWQHGTLVGKAFDVVSFVRVITQRNDERKMGVEVTGGANHRVQLTLHVFPDPIAPRTNDHAPAHLRRLGQFGGANHLLMPLRKIFVARRRDCSLWVW